MFETVMWGVHALRTRNAMRLFLASRSVYLPEMIDEGAGGSTR